MTKSDSSGTNSRSPGLLRQLREDFVVLTKARLSVLVVMTACFGYLVATKGEGTFSWATFLHMFFGTALAASGAAVFNQLMEVEADGKMHRTSDRPLPANRLPRPVAFVLGWLLCGFGMIHLGVKVNTPASLMAGATLLTYLFVYTPLKRISSLNTVVGAISGALPPLIGWAAGAPAAGGPAAGGPAAGGPAAGGPAAEVPFEGTPTGGIPVSSIVDASEWQNLFTPGAFFLFALLYLWQMPHFAAINWMYREEYVRGGFRMWSNEDESGKKTARIALVHSLAIFVLAPAFVAYGPLLSLWGGLAGALLGAVMVFLSFRFLRSGRREDARSLFFYTLLYLPLMMLASYFAWLSPRA